VALNFGSEPVLVSFDVERLSGTVLVSSLADRDGQEVTESIDLRGNEGLVVKVAGSHEVNFADIEFRITSRKVPNA
jgi:alpha-glucosidase